MGPKYKNHMRLIVMLCFIGVCFTSNAQTIKYVDNIYQSDVNVFFVNNKWEADAVVYVSDYRFSPPQVGFWYEERFYQSKGVKIYVTDVIYAADLKIYRTKWMYEVRVSDRYINEFKKYQK